MVSAMWPDRRLLDLFGVELPIIQAPMANSSGVDMAVAVAEAGGLGSFPCAGLSDDKVREGVAAIRSRTTKPINLNFFCHTEPAQDLAREAAWLERLAPYYRELSVELPKPPLKATIYRFTEATCAVVEDLRPEVVSFHFGLPAPELVQRVKRAGCKVICSATTRREAMFLAERGVDAIIAQGAEAGGHRGMFLETDVATQIGTFALVQQIVTAVNVPVIAAGGIGDASSIAAAFALGAPGRADRHRLSVLPRGNDLGAAPGGAGGAGPRDGHRRRAERPPGARHSQSLHPRARADRSGPPCLSSRHAGAGAVARKAAEAKGSGDFSWFWSGQGAVPPSGSAPANSRAKLADEALALLG